MSIELHSIAATYATKNWQGFCLQRLHVSQIADIDGFRRRCIHGVSCKAARRSWTAVPVALFVIVGTTGRWEPLKKGATKRKQPNQLPFEKVTNGHESVRDGLGVVREPKNRNQASLGIRQ